MGMRNSTDFLTHDLTPGVQNLSSTKKKLDLIFYKESAMKAGRINRSIHETDFFFQCTFPAQISACTCTFTNAFKCFHAEIVT